MVLALLWTVLGLLALGAAAAVVTRLLVRRIEAAHPPVGRFVEVGGRRIHVIDVPSAVPDGPAIVVLHGTVSSALDPYAALAGPLSRLGRALFVDRPGHGYSTRDPARDVTLAGQAEAVVGVLDRLGIGRAVLVGHSFGGAVAAALAVLRPERVAGLVLLAPATHPWPGPLAFGYRLIGSAIGGWLLGPTVTTPLGLMMLDPGLVATFAPDPLPEGYRRRSGIELALRPAAFRASADEIGALSAELARLAPRYRDIRVPTVVIAGAGDRVVSNEIHARAFADAVPGCRLMMLDGAGHIPHHGRPELVVEAVEWVLARAAGAASPAPEGGAAEALAAGAATPTDPG